MMMNTEGDLDEASCLSDLSGNNTAADEEKQQRDEVIEIRKKTEKETFQVRRWRWAVTGTLLATAVAITITTYYFLDQDEYHNFEIAYEQFARTVGNAAAVQQQDLRDSIIALSNTIS
jgi:imidazoleglycerol phosphate dehydratase HisB